MKKSGITNRRDANALGAYEASPGTLGSILALLTSTQLAVCAPFINLGFDEPNTNSLSQISGSYGNYLVGPTVDLLPGWTLFYGSNQVSTISFGAYKPFLEITTAASLIPLRTIPPELGGSSSDVARYRLTLESRSEKAPFVPADVGVSYRLRQQGDIPNEAESLTLSAVGEGSYVKVSINGEELVPWGLYPFFSSYRADISRFRGQSVNLEITTQPDWLYGITLDSITFVVPEPTTIPLLTVGGLVLWIWRRSANRA